MNFDVVHKVIQTQQQRVKKPSDSIMIAHVCFVSDVNIWLTCHSAFS